MLDKETKKKIDDLRQILVGKVTDPRSQVEQITNALLYKFTNDMDVNSVALGGVPSYFVKEFEKFSWKILIDKKTSGEERVKIYSEALEKMYFNDALPQTFREIFKNATLPFREVKVFNKFITRVNDFEYSNSESLGDAFEYLLSFMGKQGDAGQFRTPRHIIDFVVELINPSKKDRILDPASGTAGFLISAYKFILEQNKKKIPGDLLNSQDRKNISNNLNGYDISPEFLKVSLMNMFLHKFNNPNIFEYDTLSDENRWNEYFDIILANPPFFSPKGGITPHNRFSLKSKRAEILFIDYIDEHLKPNGRAGIIVPEGVIFRNISDFKMLRLKLIKNSLVGVISLPAGVFEPYSGVKTSILILDKKLSKSLDYIYFAKINNDGFSLTTNRYPINQNDIPEIKSRIINMDVSDETKLKKIKKDEIIEGNIRKHIVEISEDESIFKFKTLGEIADIKSGNPAPQGNRFFDKGEFPFIRTADVGKIKEGEIYSTQDYLNAEGIKKLKKFSKGSILFPKSGASTLLNHRVIMGIDAYVSSHLAVIKGQNKKVEDKFLFYLLKQIDTKNLVPNPSYPSLNIEEISIIELPIPDLNTQNEIIDELDKYQKIIDGCKQIIKNYTPSIEINPTWDKIKLRDIIKLSSGRGLTQNKFKKGNYNVFGGNGIVGKHNEFFLEKPTIVIGRVGAYCGEVHVTSPKSWVTDNGLYIKEKSESVEINYLYLTLISLKLNQYAKVGGQPSISQQDILNLNINLPNIETQKKISNEFISYQKFINTNKEIIVTHEDKIRKKIHSIWSN